MSTNDITKFLIFFGLSFLGNTVMGQYLRTDGANSMTAPLNIEMPVSYSSIELNSNLGSFIDFHSDMATDFDGRLAWNLNNSNEFGLYGRIRFHNMALFNGLTGIGTTSPEAGLHVKKTHALGDGTLVSARLGSGHNHWTYFGSGNSGRIRGSGEGYLWIESNPVNSGDNRLYLNATAPGDVTIAGGGGNVGVGVISPSARFHMVENSVSNLNGAEKTGVRLEIGRQKLLLKSLRTANQTDWNSTTLKLQAMIDGTNHQSIDFVNDEAYREHVDIYTGNQVFSTRFYANGNVLIGKTSQNNSTYKLDVEGKVRANEIVVNTTGADYVFEADYQLKTLGEVETFICENRHLPGIPSAEEMLTEGMAVGELNTKLLEKIEELTLYLLKHEKMIQELKQENDLLKSQITKQ